MAYSTIWRMYFSYTSAVRPTKPVSMLIITILGRTRRNSHARGVSPGWQYLASACSGTKTEATLKPPRTAWLSRLNEPPNQSTVCCRYS